MPTNIRNLASRVEPGQGPDPRGSPKTKARDRADSTRHSFLEELQQAQKVQENEVKLSAHAEQRIEQRNIPFSADDRRSVGEAMLQLSEKGARDAVLMHSEAAFVVNVPNRTVVTAMDRGEMQERVFTNIDSAYLLNR